MRSLKKIILVIIIVTYFLIGTSLAKTGNVSAQAVRLRKEKNTSSDIITNIYKGEEVEILEESGDWYRVKYQNNTGYIKKEFITEKTTNSNTQNNTNNVSENVVAPNNTIQNAVTQNNTTQSNTVTQNNTNQNVVKNVDTQNTSVQNANTQNITDENNVQASNNQSNENNSIVFVSTSANLRIIPNLMSNKITVVEAGKQLTKVSEVKNWVQVTDGNVTGWIPKAKISTSDVSQTSDVVPEPSKETNSANKVNNNIVNNTANNTNTNNTNTVANNVSNNTTASSSQTQTTSNKTGKVNVETAKVREKADQTSKFINLLDYGDTVTIIEEEGDWYKITSGSVSGYIKKTLVTVSDKNVSSRSFEERTHINSEEDLKVDQEKNNAVNDMLLAETSKINKGEEVVNYAKNYLGTAYVIGGKTPESGFDCSGFTRYVFSNFGYNLGTTAANQNNIGMDVSKENLQAGDLILFYDEGKNKIGHTGIYISNGEFIHAANPKRGVVTDNLNTNTYYNERFIVAKRIVD